MATPATTVLNTITETQEKVLDTLSIEGPVVDYVRKAADYVEPNLPEFPTKDLTEDVPTIRQFVDNQFAFAAKVLDTSTSSCSSCSTPPSPSPRRSPSRSRPPASRRSPRPPPQARRLSHPLSSSQFWAGIPPPAQSQTERHPPRVVGLPEGPHGPFGRFRPGPPYPDGFPMILVGNSPRACRVTDAPFDPTT